MPVAKKQVSVLVTLEFNPLSVHLGYRMVLIDG